VATYTNTIVAGGSAASASNCQTSALVLTSGRSLDSTDQCGMGAYDMKNLDPQLGPLAANGGPTPTMAPALSSVVIDAAQNCPPPTTDQRGVARPQGAACDIGAVEQALPAPAAVTPAVQDLKLSASTFAASDSGTSMIARRRRSIGTVVSYQLPALASVRFSVLRRARGKYRTVKGGFTDDGNRGPNSFRFSGRMAGRKLRPGSYRLVAVPTDATGHKGPAVRRGFRIAKR
jgi:hypothetical protein